MVSVDKIRRFAVDIDQTVEDVAAWPEPRSNHVGMDATGEGIGGGTMWAA